MGDKPATIPVPNSLPASYGELFKLYLDKLVKTEEESVDLASTSLKLLGRYKVTKDNKDYTFTHTQAMPNYKGNNETVKDLLKKISGMNGVTILDKNGYYKPKISESVILSLKEGDIEGAPPYYELFPLRPIGKKYPGLVKESGSPTGIFNSPLPPISRPSVSSALPPGYVYLPPGCRIVCDSLTNSMGGGSRRHRRRKTHRRAKSTRRRHTVSRR